MLCDNLEGWDRARVGGRLKRGHIYLKKNANHHLSLQKVVVVTSKVSDH